MIPRAPVGKAELELGAPRAFPFHLDHALGCRFEIARDGLQHDNRLAVHDTRTIQLRTSPRCTGP